MLCNGIAKSDYADVSHILRDVRYLVIKEWKYFYVLKH